MQNIFHNLTMDVVTKVGVGHHKDGDVGQAEQNFIAGFWYVPIYDGFIKEACMYLHTSVNWANLSSTAPEYTPTQKIVCQENIDRGKKLYT